MKSIILKNYKIYSIKLIFLSTFLLLGLVLIRNRHLVKKIYSPQSIFVRISGKVKNPGVYRLNSGSTVQQLIDRAGGISNHNDKKIIFNPDLILNNGQVFSLGMGK